jgi:hypothetical protein
MVFHQLATKAQALAMKAMGATLNHIKRITEIKRRALQYIFELEVAARILPLACLFLTAI